MTVVDSRQLPPCQPAAVTDFSDDPIRRAKAFMAANISEPITVNDISRAAHFSKFHFSRIFQAGTGYSPGRYLSRMRLREAMRLLRSTDMRIIEITFAVGYSSVGTFSSRFHELVGLSPSAFRRQHQSALTQPGVSQPGAA